ncbi:cytochrome c [Geothrix rubra]|uniref:Cytochrome c n=1 Tax=Geothrix rubra TaxID=2927977 RepID=A0ABQ5Q4A8_9BACT|nr:ABC transporter substrate-binding protein [Geothrix rubra]GLH69271.1 cytochrome c [Geothrix rubra]
MRALAAALALAAGLTLSAGARRQAPQRSRAQILALGERMYREGILPSGEPLQGVVKGDVPVSGAAFTCRNCHLRSGMGSYEGGVATPPITAAKLFQRQFWQFPSLTEAERIEAGVAQSKLRRPAYTDGTLADAIRTGVDPLGRTLNDVMPRYDLSPADMAILVAYLRTLSAEVSPGVTATTIRFATVLTPDVTAAEEEALRVPLDNFIASHNRLPQGFGNRMYRSASGRDMSLSHRQITLARWRLTGPPATWGAQLEAHQRREPVFALLGGMSHGDWKPIHTFCETRGIPCLFPLTDLPVVSDTDWYTVYFSKGLWQEGEAAARFLAGRPEGADPGRIVQAVADSPRARAAAMGFDLAWQEAGKAPVKTVRLPAGGLQEAALREWAAKGSVAVVLWDGPGAYPALAALAGPQLPVVFMASGLLGPRLGELPEAARASTYVTYPFRAPADEPKFARYANSLLAGLTALDNTERIYTRMYSLVEVLKQALMDMDRSYYRDAFLDALGMQKDRVLPDYERLSFGPGQRYAAKGCYVMQLTPGPQPVLVKRSDWVIH